MKRFYYILYLTVYLLCCLLAFQAATGFSRHHIKEKLTEETATTLYEQAVSIASVYGASYFDVPLSADSVQANLAFLANYLSSTIWIIDTDGTLLVSSDTSENSALPISFENFDPTDMGTKNYMLGNYYGYFKEDKLTVLSTILSDYEIRGYIVLHIPAEQLDAQAASLMPQRYLVILFALITALILFTLFAILLLRPLRKIDLESRASNQTTAIERNMIANISHDFRSPLTSIKGYAEAMADGTIPPEASGKYLHIIISEADRLHQLTENLLALNRYDTMEIELTPSVFDINQVLRDTGVLFEGRCLNKKTSLNLLLSGKNLAVYADEGKIKQVIYNLVDNAIKFSHPNSVIVLETGERNEKALVSIKDSGIGIPKEALPHIWERFYKTDLSRGKDKQGFGLGLSIVRKILQAHGETIEVTSTEGAGAKFTFTLPKAGE